jgi:adenylate cyclase
VGIGIHTGRAFVGVVGGDESTRFHRPGDNVNITARLASQAGPGEILISEASYTAANLNREDLEGRQMELKGRNEPIGVRILRVDPS